MTLKRKPAGTEFADFCRQWDDVDHNGKIMLANQYGVTYDTARHWRVGGEVPTRKRTANEPRMTITAQELLEMRPAVALDFVMFDLETSGFDADWDIILCGSIKPYGKEPVTFRADEYPEWETSRADDKKITIDIANELRKHAIVVGHYSEKFDTMFLRAKMFRHGIEPLPQMFGIDTWRIALKNFKVSSRRQRSLSMFAQLRPEKDEPEGDRWMRAAFNGEREAMDKIVEHNIIDVRELEKLACISFPYLRSIPKL